MKIFFSVVLFTAVMATGCKETLPKPKSFLRLDYPTATYKFYQKKCNFGFKVNENTLINENEKCEIKIEYPSMKATVYLNYRPVSNNLNILLRDAQKLTYEHVIKADDITEQPYEDIENKVFGMYYRVGGNAASNAQFYLTDNAKHFLVGSVYFYAKPNFDSIYPASKYIENDIQLMIESLRWKN